MDEKLAVSRNDLTRALTKQINKRTAAPAPTPEKATANLAAVTAASAKAANEGFDADDFFVMWDKYYPTVVSLLGYASWFIPGPAVNIIKSLLAVVNNNILPILREALK